MLQMVRFLSFLWPSNIPSHTHIHIHTHHLFFIHSSIVGHLRCFSILAIVNNTAVNIRVIYLFELVFWIRSNKHPEVELLDHKVVLFLIFWGTSIVFSVVPALICIPTNNSAWRFPFPTSLQTLVCWFIDDSRSDRCEVTSHCGFNLHFSND